jgi:GNAT superfamily N-acetyltransferase
MVKIKLRQANFDNEGERNFIIDTWLKSFKDSHFAGPLPDNMYWKVYSEVLNRLLDKEGVSVLVACSSEDSNVIYGYIAIELFDIPVCHYLYVKYIYRGMGIARALFGKAVEGKFAYTFPTKESGKLTSTDGPFPGGYIDMSYIRRKKYDSSSS